MKLLLDTHVLLWWFANDPTLSQEAKKLIADPKNVVFVSAASAWEMAIKKALGKLEMPGDMESAIAINHFEILPITIRHALGVGDLPPHHTDPFDRLLISQTKIEYLTLVTRDERLLEYKVPIVHA